MSVARGFVSRHHILEGHFSHIFVVKIVLWCFIKKTKINEERGTFFKSLSESLSEIKKQRRM